MINLIKTVEVIPKKVNTVVKHKKFTTHPWKTTDFPTMEFTTNIPLKGCPVDCVFCPQRVLTKAYSDLTMLSLDSFKHMVDKLPLELRVTFAGFTEPFVNNHCADMIVYAHETGHPVSVFTTGIGMSVEDFEKIAHIPFAGNPNGGFMLHLPPKEKRAKHPITDRYRKLLQHIKENEHRVQNFDVMCMGEVLDEFSHLWNGFSASKMYSRAGNLEKERLLKPELLPEIFYWASHPPESPTTCNCPEGLYHNVCLPNGDVVLCCMDYNLEHVLGNLILESYEEIAPEPYTCFEMCNSCENGVSLNDMEFTYTANR